MTPGARLTTNALTRRHRDGERTNTVLNDVSISIEPGEFVAVVGPSGAGKSTFLHIAGGLDRGYTGSMRIDDDALESMSDRTLARFRARTVGFVFQSFNLLPGLTLLDNVMLPGFFADESDGGSVRAFEALASVGLEGKEHRRPGELSGGERQRVAVARALWMRPRLLLADEPTGNLDEETGARIIDLIARLNSELGVTVVIVTHEKRISDRATRTLRVTAGKLEETNG